MLHLAAACHRADAPACVRLLLREGAQIEAFTNAEAGMAAPHAESGCLGSSQRPGLLGLTLWLLAGLLGLLASPRTRTTR